MEKSTEIYAVNKLEKPHYETLFEISKALISPEYSESLFNNALDLIIELLVADRGAFVSAKNEFKIITARDKNKETIKNLNLFSANVINSVVETKEAVLYHDVQSNPNTSNFESLQIQNIKSIIGVPVVRDGNVWGVILIDSKTDRTHFTNDNLMFLNFFANLLSLALDKIETLENLQKEKELLVNKIQELDVIPDVIGTSKSMRSLNKLVHKVAPKDATVLILGESGTGKDLIARAIHQLSSRSAKPFLIQNCSSIPDTLLESELFGYKKGAFTGADKDKIGLFEAADGGTFFLDEIGDMPMNLQAKILRVLENQEITRLGDTMPRKINVRIIAATNKNLKQLAEQKKFRHDLYFRLNVFPIEIPPLRERKSDIALLARHFIYQFAGKKIALSNDALKMLEQYSWQGNIRELQNILKRAVIICENDKIMPGDINLSVAENQPAQGTLKDIEFNILLERLKEFDGNRTQTAKSLDVSVRWIQLKLKENGMN